MQTTQEEISFSCHKINKDGTQCTKKYKLKTSLFGHDLEKHSDIFRYTCDHCKFQTNVQATFNKHIRSNKHQKYLQIQGLIEELQKYQQTMSPSISDSRSSSDQCDIAESSGVKLSFVPQNITNSIRITLEQTRENPQMKCEFCDEILSFSAMKSHIVRKHLICICKTQCTPTFRGTVQINCKNLERYYCKVPECAKHFYSSKACKKHEAEIHDSPDLLCPETSCQMVFKKQADLDKHIKAHEFQKKINNIVQN